MTHEIRIKAEWDAEAKVWAVTESTLHGLCTEAETIDGLAANIKMLIPELLSEQTCVPFELLTQFKDGSRVNC